MDYLPINQSINPAYEEWFLLYNCLCQAAEPACVNVCVCVSEQHERGLCSSVYPVRPASVRFLGDSSHAFAHRPVNILVRVFHRFFSGYKGSGLLYVHDVSTWRRVGMKPEVRVIIPKCVGETYFSFIQPKPEESASWIGGRLSGFDFNPRDLRTFDFVFSPRLTKVSVDVASVAKTKHNRWFFVLQTDSWIMFYK